MTPSNPSNSQPLIYRIMDALGVSHLVACINHTHEQSEVTNLTTDLSAKMPKVASPTTGNFPKFKGDGTLEDSGKSASDFAAPNEIKNGENLITVASDSHGIHIEAPAVTFSVYDNSEGDDVTLLPERMENFYRAIHDPDSTPTANSTNLITSGGVKAALDEFIVFDANNGQIPVSQFGYGKIYHILVTNPTEKWVHQYFTKEDAFYATIQILGDKVVTSQNDFGMLDRKSVV